MQKCGLYCPAWPQSKIERNRKEGEVPRTCKGIEKLWYTKVTVIRVVIDALGTVTKGVVKSLEDLEIKRSGGDNRKYSIAESG